MKTDELVKRLREHAEWAQANEWEVPLCMADDLEAAVDKLTADVAPVRHGRWIWDDEAYLRCSECTQKAPVTQPYEDEPMSHATNYCPYCGAKMDGENNGEQV